NFIETWLPRFRAENRSYITVAIGCTGGQHRSVYVAQKLFDYFGGQPINVQVRHRELS
ncbi:MAG: RNase adaptor protein RapZ, partial [Gammaproteobacteria bacterium]|nr:RNase adaptor protein RapZ [Gammaproteobacteria bacterium]